MKPNLLLRNKKSAASDHQRQPALCGIAASLAMLGFAAGAMVMPVAAQSLLPKAANPQLVRAGDPYFQRVLRAKEFSPFSSFNFNNTPAGYSALQVFTLTNDSGGPMTFGGPQPAVSNGSVPGAFTTIAGTTCSGSLAYGSSCQVTVKFSPPTAGYYYGTLTVNTTPPTQSVGLDGYGDNAPFAAFAPGGVQFGSQPVGVESAPQRVVLTNTGFGVLNVAQISASNPFDVIVCDPGIQEVSASSGAKRLGPTCAPLGAAGPADPKRATTPPIGINETPLLAPQMCSPNPYLFYNESCYFDVVFTPQLAGSFSGSVQLQLDQLGVSPQSLPLVGASGPAQAIAVSPEALNFGDVQLLLSAGPTPLSIANTGFNAVTINSVSIVPDVPGQATPSNLPKIAAATDFSLTTNCEIIAPGAGCSAQVKFKPGGLGEREANLKIEGTFEGSPKLVRLSGNGLPIPFPYLTFSAASVGYGDSTLGAVKKEIIKLTNGGQLPVIFSSIYARGDFSVTHNCPPILESGKSCDVEIAFRASVPGLRSGEVVILSNAEGGDNVIKVTGKGCRTFTPRNARLGIASCS